MHQEPVWQSAWLGYIKGLWELGLCWGDTLLTACRSAQAGEWSLGVIALHYIA